MDDVTGKLDETVGLTGFLRAQTRYAMQHEYPTTQIAQLCIKQIVTR